MIPKFSVGDIVILKKDYNAPIILEDELVGLPCKIDEIRRVSFDKVCYKIHSCQNLFKDYFYDLLFEEDELEKI